LAGQYVRKSLDLRSWDAATDLVRGWESTGKIGEIRKEIPTIAQAVDRYLEDCTARLKPPSVKKYRTLLKNHFLPFCEKRGVRQLSQLNVSFFREFRNSWTFSPVTQAKSLEQLRAFGRFCAADEWIKGNPVTAVKAPLAVHNPTLPFTETDMKKLFAACRKWSGNGVKMEALILLMRRAGLRISDAVTLKRSELVNGRVFLHQAKTGTPVYVPVPPKVTAALKKLDERGEYFFWSGNGEVKSAIEDCRRAFSAVAKLAGVQNAHFHRLRDSFAVSLLQNGVSLEEVSILLGHASIRVTERHYAPWVKARQDRLEAAVRRAW
jgi:site-specific recombinase XerD